VKWIFFVRANSKSCVLGVGGQIVAAGNQAREQKQLVFFNGWVHGLWISFIFDCVPFDFHKPRLDGALKMQLPMGGTQRNGLRIPSQTALALLSSTQWEMWRL
jgi:hypothetical protein